MIRPREADRESLVAELRRRGIRFLAPSDAKLASIRLSDAQLLVTLARHPDPRLRLSLIPWFILHPEIHAVLPGVIDELSFPATRELEALYMAAVYLQRLWRTRLSFYLDDFEELPDLFSEKLGLPAPDERYGKAGVHAVAEWHARQLDYPVNRLASYEKMMDLLFAQLIGETREHVA